MPPLLNHVYPRLEKEAQPSTAAVEEAWLLLKLGVRGKPVEGEEAGALEVTKLFLLFTIYNIADGGLNTLLTSMAGSMTTNVSIPVLLLTQGTQRYSRQSVGQLRDPLTPATRSLSCSPSHSSTKSSTHTWNPGDTPTAQSGASSLASS